MTGQERKPAKRRTKPAEQRRADLLAAARTVFVAKGVTAATLEDVTTAAGVSKGLFWQYFRSKEELVFALQQQYAQRFAQTVLAATDAVDDWTAKLDTFVQAGYDQFQAELDLHDVLFRHTGREQTGPDQPPAHTVLVEVLIRILTDGAAAGAYRVDDPETMAYFLYAAMHAFDESFQDGRRLPEAQLRVAQQLFRRAAGVTEPG